MISLDDILLAREQRAQLQQMLLARWHCPLICFTMNIAGPEKTSPLILRGFHTGLRALEAALSEFAVLDKRITYAETGYEAFFAVEADAAVLKQLCMQIEDGSPLGRLFDMDVLDCGGRKLDRNVQRGCIVCGKPGRACAAGRLHPVGEIQAAATGLLQDGESVRIADLAVLSLTDEVLVTPKPGLVDRRNCGSHEDMDVQTFLDSAKALRPYFARCVRIGQETVQQPPDVTFARLRQAGLQAEEAMYAATKGVNTHKGAIFTLGILCGSYGRLWQSDITTDTLLAQCAAVGQTALDDFTQASGATAGERLYLQRGLRGIRGEVAEGLPSVRSISLPVYRQNGPAVALLHLIANVDDSNLYRRGGEEGAAWAKCAAQALLPAPSLEEIKALDDAFIARNLSPGGCADLLAATIFLSRLEEELQ